MHVTAIIVLLTFFTIHVGAETLPLSPLLDVGGHYFQGAELTGGSPMTLKTQFHVSEKADISNLKGVHLVGLSIFPDGAPTALSLMWAEDRSGWVPIWSLVLQSDAGLLSTGSTLHGGPDFIADSQYVKIMTDRPEIGHEYSAELSYDPVTGQITVGVTNMTVGTRLFTRKIVGQPSSTPYYPGVGIVGDQSIIQFNVLETTSRRVPFTVPLDMFITEEGIRNPLLSYRLWNKADIDLRLGADASNADGSFVLQVVGDKGVIPLVSYSGLDIDDEVIIPIASEQLPLGEIQLELQYYDESGKAWLLDLKRLQVVAANLRAHYSPLVVEEGQLRGVMTVRSDDGDVPDIGYELVATIGHPDRKSGDTRTSVKMGTLSNIGNLHAEIPFSVPFPVDRSVFSLTFDMEFDAPVNNINFGNHYHVIVAPKG